MIVSLSSIMTLVANHSLATHNNLVTPAVSSVTYNYYRDQVMLLIGDSTKMSYDSGISSGPPGGMFSSSKLCCALFRIYLLYIPNVEIHCY